MSTTPGRRPRPCAVPAVPYLGAIAPPPDADRPSEAGAPDTRPSPLCRAARIRRR